MAEALNQIKVSYWHSVFFFVKLGVFLEQKIEGNLLVQQEVSVVFTARLWRGGNDHYVGFFFVGMWL